ncbi:YwmB family TATA-box binding protein [Virgibacillus sp. DJP39]|uniref:YwmB family TATA-box binding protein n=1 Tax=Virgibacillus sp. DJP39 TaxID=3409790 RepID=UPI003BB4AE4A
MSFQIRRNWLITFSLITLGIITIINQSNNTYAENDVKDDGLLLMRTMSEENIESEKVILNYSGLVNTYKDPLQIHSFKTELEQAFSTNLSITSEPDEKKVIKYQGQKVVSSVPNTKIKVALAGVLNENREYEVFLNVSLLSNSTIKNDFFKNYTHLKNALDNASVKPEIIVNIQGSLDEKLSHSSQKQIIMEMFKNLNASVFEGLNEKEVISLTGFSKELSYSIKSKNRINIQISSRFDDLAGKTTFTIGTPIITIEY